MVLVQIARHALRHGLSEGQPARHAEAFGCLFRRDGRIGRAAAPIVRIACQEAIAAHSGVLGPRMREARPQHFAGCRRYSLDTLRFGGGVAQAALPGQEAAHRGGSGSHLPLGRRVLAGSAPGKARSGLASIVAPAAPPAGAVGGAWGLPRSGRAGAACCGASA